MILRRRLAAAVLAFESVVVLFAIAVAVQVAGVDSRTAAVAGVGLAAALVVTSGLLRHTWAYVLGTLLQVAVLATGFVVPVMWALGAIFALLWLFALHLGAKAVALERARGATPRGP